MLDQDVYKKAVNVKKHCSKLIVVLIVKSD